MYTITITNEYGSKSFDYEEQKSNEIMVEINECLNGEKKFITLNRESSEMIYTTEILLKSQISNKEKPEVFFF
jgi:hypothetical protein